MKNVERRTGRECVEFPPMFIILKRHYERANRSNHFWDIEADSVRRHHRADRAVLGG